MKTATLTTAILLSLMARFSFIEETSINAPQPKVFKLYRK